MRLYLSSFKIGNRPQKLRELVGSGSKALVIMNALDNRQEARDKFLLSESEVLKTLGFSVEELDLRKFAGKQDELKELLSKNDLVWINGGNTFILRRAMKVSGFDNLIVGLLKEDKIVYGGFSAAVVILSKDLHGLDITDDPNDVPEGYDKEILWDGLGLLDYSVAVHYKSNHSETELTDKEIGYYKANNIPFKTLSDGQVIVINGSDTKILD